MGDRPVGRNSGLGASLAVARASELDLTLVDAPHELARRGTHDPLTGLANRSLLLARLDSELSARERDHPIAVLFCDVDHFKLVNDTLGHAIGDEVLAAVAARLAEHSREDDTVARLGGDEFAIVIAGAAADHASALAERLVQVMREPIATEHRLHRLTMSIGVAVTRGRRMQPADLLGEADAALYEAKTGGRDRVEFFSQAHASRLRERAEIECDLRLALAADELAIEYQPIVDLLSGCAVGVEALVRWDHPSRGRLMPTQFLGVAEETGLATEIDQAILRTACEQLSCWSLLPNAPRMMSVNVAGRNFSDAGMVDAVHEIIVNTGVDPTMLCIEITESTVLNTSDATLASLSRLRNLGCYLAIDDFGTGYSSLAAVRQLPVEVIKVDRTFISGVAEDRQDAAVVAAVMSLSHALGMHVIAEGVERPEQVRALEELGCTTAQGFLFGPSLPAVDIPDVWKVAPSTRRSLYAAESRIAETKAMPLFIDEFMFQMGIPRRGL